MTNLPVEDLFKETRNKFVDSDVDLGEFVSDEDEYPRYITVFHYVYQLRQMEDNQK